MNPRHLPPLPRSPWLGLIILSAFLACAGPEPAADNKAHLSRQDDLESLYWARIDSSRMNFTQADVKFMTDMIAHHAQALVMSRLAPENGAGPTIQVLAARIINAQEDEIATMQKWLRDRDQPVPGPHHHTMDHHHGMPGMLTAGQLDRLARLQGPDFDRNFLELMIEHHEGAVYMVRELFKVDGAASGTEAFILASGIHAEQVTEIERMKRMLEARIN